MPTSQALYKRFSVAVVDDAARKRIEMEPLFQSEALDERSDLLFLRLAHDRVMQAQADILRLVGGKAREPLDGQIDALPLVGPAGVERDERALRILKAGKHLSLRAGAGRRGERRLQEVRERVEAIPVDAVRDDLDGGKFARLPAARFARSLANAPSNSFRANCV